MKTTKYVFLYSQAALDIKGHPQTAHLRTRMEILPQVTEILGAKVAELSVEKLLGVEGEAEADAARQEVADGDIVIIDGPKYPREIYERIEREIVALKVPFFDSFEHYRLVSDMSQYLPIFAANRIPQARSVLIPFTEEDLERTDSKEFYKRVIGQRIDMLLEKGGLHPTKTHPVFYRTFHSSAVGSNVWRFRAESVVDLVNSSYEVVYDKKGCEDIGGLVVRQWQELDKIYPVPMHDVFREYRVFVIGGEPIWYSFYQGLSRIDTKGPDFEEFKERAILNAREIRRLKQLSAKIAGLIPSHYFTIDFAYDVNGKVQVMDLGPAFCAGMAFKIDQVPVLAALLHYAAQVARNPKILTERASVEIDKLIHLEELTEIVDTLKISRLPLGIFCGLLM